MNTGLHQHRRSYTWHTQPLDLAQRLGLKSLNGSRKIGRNDIDIIIGEQPKSRPSNRIGRMRPNRSQVRPVGVGKRKTVTGDASADGMDQQSPNSDGRGLQIDNIGSFQIDWRDIHSRAEMMDSGKPFDALATRHPYPPSPLRRNEVPHE